MKILAGFTGFVGGNIAAACKFDMLCNSKNISEAFKTNPDLLVYSGVPAEMFLANNNPAADKAVTDNAADNIRKINPKRLVLISTIAALDNPVDADEDVQINPERLTVYGLNRLDLEKKANNIVKKCHVIRLPGLFGSGIKKNFIYDMINFLPAMLNKAKYDELSAKEPLIAENYIGLNNGFYKLVPDLVRDNEKKAKLKEAFLRCSFSALNFTDSRSVFQYYNLLYLWGHIKTVIEYDIPLLHTAAEPVSAGKLYEHIYGKPFINELPKPPFNYNFKTKYADAFGGKDGYIFTANQVMKEISEFMEDNKID